MGFVRSACGLFLALQPVAYSWDVPTEACRNTYMLNPPNAVSPIRDTTPESTDPCLNECQDGNIKVRFAVSRYKSKWWSLIYLCMCVWFCCCEEAQLTVSNFTGGYLEGEVE